MENSNVSMCLVCAILSVYACALLHVSICVCAFVCVGGNYSGKESESLDKETTERKEQNDNDVLQWK